MENRIRWSIDKVHSEISFKIRHLMITNVKGQFRNYEASIYTTGTDFTNAEINLSIDPSSIDTGSFERDEHLKGPEFFNVQNFEQIVFSSKNIGEKDSNGEHELWGDLTIKSVTKHIMLKVEFGGMALDGYNREKAGFLVTGLIKRSDWGLVWNSAVEGGGLLVGDEVRISCEIQLINLSSEDDIMILENNTEKINN